MSRFLGRACGPSSQAGSRHQQSAHYPFRAPICDIAAKNCPAPPCFRESAAQQHSRTAFTASSASPACFTKTKNNTSMAAPHAHSKVPGRHASHTLTCLPAILPATTTAAIHRLRKTERQKRRKGLFPRCPAHRNKNENLKEKGAPLNQRSAQRNGCTVRRQHPHKPDCRKRQRNSIHRSGPERLPVRRQGNKGHRRNAGAHECPSLEKAVRILVGKPHSRRCHHVADECREQDGGQDPPRHARQLPRPIEQLIEQSAALNAMRPPRRTSARFVATEIAPARIDAP